MTDKNYNSIAKGRFASSFKDISDDAIANEFKVHLFEGYTYIYMYMYRYWG